MDFLGLTYLGPSSWIRESLLPGCGDPATPANTPALLARVASTTTCITEVPRQSPQMCVVDCYVGRADGFAYHSTQRLRRMRTRHLRKPLGPRHQYRRTPYTSAEYGWWSCDPALAQAKWMATSPRCPRPVAPFTKILDKVRQNDKYASLF